ncbi:SPOR domain-containing protein [Candidatus Marithrix sp. Canyon 246]|uniref:SPOR domain-containing protein n=1 Tax=Candidatus Marithrix sp. Canyon 246 TaxID=1827136 RepID=UPI00084A2869|nr:SPOR domain-containing protein [Candidatus Marithrix sp. Canyon 246]
MRSLALLLILVNLIFFIYPKNHKISAETQTTTCFKIGPYKDLNQLKQIENQFNNQKVKIEQTQQLISTWIYLPPFKNRKAAIRAKYKLKQKGIDHFMIITTGKFKYAISLGFFSQTKYINRRIKELKAKGFHNFKQQERYKTNYWLTVKLPSEESLKNIKHVLCYEK